MATETPAWTALDERHRAGGPAPRAHGTVRLVVARLGKGKHRVLPESRLTRDEGLVGDRWSLDSDPERNSQITLMEARVVETLKGFLVPDAGDNLLVDFDLSEGALPDGAKLRIGGALVEVTPEPHTGCAKFRARFGSDALRWINAKERRSARLRGIHVRVLEDGAVKAGDAILRA